MKRGISLILLLLILVTSALPCLMLTAAADSDEAKYNETVNETTEAESTQDETDTAPSSRSRAIFILLTVPVVVGALVFVTMLYKKKDEQRYL